MTARVILLEQRPLPPEICDNIDNDKNGLIDDNVIEKEKCGTGECEGIRERTCSAGIWDFWSDCSGEGKTCNGGICQKGRCSSSDKDGDGVADSEDNCPNVYNPDQTDADKDGYGAACDGNDNDSTIYPGAPEIPGDGKDNDGDGKIDEQCDVDINCPAGNGSCMGQYNQMYYEAPGICTNGECSYGNLIFTNCTISMQYCNFYYSCVRDADCKDPPNMCDPNSCNCM